MNEKVFNTIQTLLESGRLTKAITYNLKEKRIELRLVSEEKEKINNDVMFLKNEDAADENEQKSIIIRMDKNVLRSAVQDISVIENGVDLYFDNHLVGCLHSILWEDAVPWRYKLKFMLY